MVQKPRSRATRPWVCRRCDWYAPLVQYVRQRAAATGRRAAAANAQRGPSAPAAPTPTPHLAFATPHPGLVIEHAEEPQLCQMDPAPRSPPRAPRRPCSSSASASCLVTTSCPSHGAIAARGRGGHRTIRKPGPGRLPRQSGRHLTINAASPSPCPSPPARRDAAASSGWAGSQERRHDARGRWPGAV